MTLHAHTSNTLGSEASEGIVEFFIPSAGRGISGYNQKQAISSEHLFGETPAGGELLL